MRATDFFLIFPQIFVLLFLSYLLRQANVQFFVGGFGDIVLVIAVTSWMVVARLVRAAFLKLREEEYVDAARAYGAGTSSSSITSCRVPTGSSSSPRPRAWLMRSSSNPACRSSATG